MHRGSQRPRQRFEERRAGRRDQLALAVARDDLEALEQKRSGRSRHREAAVLAVDETTSRRQRADKALLDRELIEAPTDPDDIDNRVDRANLMKVHALRLDTVNPRLGLGEYCEDSQAALGRALRQPAAGSRLDQAANRRPDPVRVMDVLALRDQNVERGSTDSVDFDGFVDQPVAGDLECLERCAEALDAQPATATGIEQSAHRHVAADPGSRVEVCDFHSKVVPDRPRTGQETFFTPFWPDGSIRVSANPEEPHIGSPIAPVWLLL